MAFVEFLISQCATLNPNTDSKNKPLKKHCSACVCVPAHLCFSFTTRQSITFSGYLDKDVRLLMGPSCSRLPGQAIITFTFPMEPRRTMQFLESSSRKRDEACCEGKQGRESSRENFLHFNGLGFIGLIPI